MALNAIDGMMAREHGMKSAAGAVLNELGDVISDAALYLPFALVAGVNAPLVVLVVTAAIIGEMAVLLGTPHSATVTAEVETRVRVIEEAIDVLQQNPDFALHIATLACARLNATSALLVDLRRGAEGRKQEQALMSRILSAMLATPKVTGRPSRWADHE